MDNALRGQLEDITNESFTIKVLDEQGCTSEVRKLQTVTNDYILKTCYKPKYRHWLKTEAEVLKKKKHLPIPRYFGFFEEENSSHLLMSFEEGVTLRQAIQMAESLEEEKQLIKSFGVFLCQFHEDHIDNASNHKWLDGQLIKAAHYLANEEADGSEELLRRLNENKPAAVRQTLIHGDCTTDNVLVREGEVYLFIDVAGTTMGDPRYDEALAIGRFKTNRDYLEAFYEGYTRNRMTEEEYRYFDEGLYEFF
ncbi:phosphotransferase family protein [Bacillus sp. SCS-153A]|uniref:phosphotransferase family protein n=1 Tax=Rossellomorea sedimentorum TaxID=3115294 RepID=UPI00390698D6